MFKRIFIILVLLGLAVYLVFAITSFNKPNNEARCNGVDICLVDSNRQGFLGKADLKQILLNGEVYPQNKKLSYVDLRKIEHTLLRNAFVEKVECYKTPTGRVHIDVKRRLPILRVMSDRGGDYYIDAEGKVMPHANIPANVTVASGNISKQYAQVVLTKLGRIIHADQFWTDQIEQVYVLYNGDIELIPRVGNHTIFFGQPFQMERKMDRLKMFYTNGLGQVGWNKYSSISLDIDNQIVCTKN
jgi:cell division protein FtsQ